MHKWFVKLVLSRVQIEGAHHLTTNTPPDVKSSQGQPGSYAVWLASGDRMSCSGLPIASPSVMVKLAAYTYVLLRHILLCPGLHISD